MKKSVVKAETAINLPMAPMLDVVLQILVFFVVTYRSTMPEAHLEVNLPSPGGRAAKDARPPAVLEVKVLPGQVLLQGIPRDPEAMKEMLIQIGKLDPNQTVLIKTDRLARTEELVRVLDICRGAKLTKLNLLTLR